MPDPFARKTYLHAVADPELPVRFSIGKRTRALQLQSFLKTLSAAAAAKTPSETALSALELVVLTQADWRRQVSAPYGWGMARRTDAEVVLALPAGYPPRLIARWDAVRLRAAQAGVGAPGSVSAFLDAGLGLEWAHALLLTQQQGRAPRAWLREVAAAYLYQAVLRELGDTERLEYLRAWARTQQAGATPRTDEPDADARLAETALFDAEYELEFDGVRAHEPPEPKTSEPKTSEPETFNLETSEKTSTPKIPKVFEPKAFSYPRSKMPLDDLLWTQSGLWLQATELAQTHGWTLTAAEVRTAAQEKLKAALRAPSL